MKLAVLKERITGETRVAATPETVKKFIAAGHGVTIETGAGTGASISDTQYKEAGANIAKTATAALKGADILLCVRRPGSTVLAGLKKGAGIAGLLDPFDDTAFVRTCATKGIDLYAMEFIPRISRAQSMDALSSQSNLAGYRAVIEAAALFGKALPMMMTAAGTVAPAKAFIMGAGVAGLQAIATARRLGAIVTATDVRPAAKEQVASLGAKFIAVEDEEFKAAETAGGYAKQMSAEYQKKQAELVAKHIAKQDIVITTALIPGRPAPKLVDEAMVKAMPPGAIIIDMAAERGGNCTLTQAGKTIVKHGVTIAGFTNLPARLAAATTALYAKNLLNFLPLLSGEKGEYAPHWDDEIVTGANLTRAGKITNEAFAAKTPAAKKAAVKKAATKKPAAAKKSTTKAAPKKAAAPKTAAKKPAAKKATAKKPAAKKPAPKRAATKAKPKPKES
ncbi:MAG: Re/Si-specific NAD(P)(+) transhydrogenase subunit alpha [Robiginitomaculum sp.]|nr:Re/Si-specific NAD(P)(+) transhydrogenase subunit alpha [Robiginitomaculum sp.]MDQ7076943.1 Re/Si-specific NAD(P)(+) transhydrogenase subunit alpha [Robiginitomaculum sp.]